MKNFKKRWINTRTVWEWDGEQYVRVENEGYEYAGPVALAGAADTYEDAYRFYNSANDTPIDAQDANTTLDVDTTYVLRLRIYNAGTKDEDSLVYQLQRENTTQATGVGDVTGSSTHVQTADASGLTNGSAVSASTLTGAAGDFIAGEQVEDGTPTTLVIVQQDYTEMHYSFTIVGTDVNNGDTILLTATCPNNPNVTATITVNKASAGVDQLDFERGTPGVMRGVGRGV